MFPQEGLARGKFHNADPVFGNHDLSKLPLSFILTFDFQGEMSNDTKFITRTVNTIHDVMLGKRFPLGGYPDKLYKCRPRVQGEALLSNIIPLETSACVDEDHFLVDRV